MGSVGFGIEEAVQVSESNVEVDDRVCASEIVGIISGDAVMIEVSEMGSWEFSIGNMEELGVAKVVVGGEAAIEGGTLISDGEMGREEGVAGKGEREDESVMGEEGMEGEVVVAGGEGSEGAISRRRPLPWFSPRSDKVVVSKSVLETYF